MMYVILLIFFVNYVSLIFVFVLGEVVLGKYINKYIKGVKKFY